MMELRIGRSPPAHRAGVVPSRKDTIVQPTLLRARETQGVLRMGSEVQIPVWGHLVTLIANTAIKHDSVCPFRKKAGMSTSTFA